MPVNITLKKETDSFIEFVATELPIPEGLTEQECTHSYTVIKGIKVTSFSPGSLFFPGDGSDFIWDLIDFGIGGLSDSEYEDKAQEVEILGEKIYKILTTSTTADEAIKTCLACIIDSFPEYKFIYNNATFEMDCCATLNGHELQAAIETAHKRAKKSLQSKIAAARKKSNNDKKVLENLLMKYSMQDIAKVNADLKKREKEKETKTKT